MIMCWVFNKFYGAIWKKQFLFSEQLVYTEFDRKVEASTGFSCSDTTFPKKKTASAKKKERCIMKDKKERLVVESESDTRQLIELKKRLSELERIIGQKQILIDFQNKMIELAEETYGVDIKKKFFTPPPATSGNTEKSWIAAWISFTKV